MKRITTFALIAALYPGLVLADGIDGEYTVNGVEPIGTPYQTTATVTQLSETTATIEIQFPAEPVTGNCMLTETHIACHADIGTRYYTMAIYDRRDDGSFDGVWVHSALAGSGQETLTPVP